MKKILKNKWLWLILIIIIVAAGWFGYQSNKSKNTMEISTEDVSRGDLLQTVSATGAVQSAKEIELNFNAQGKITFLPIKEGETVKAGQILARLDAGSVEAQIRQLRAEVDAASAELARVRAGASAEDIGLTNARVAKALSDISSLTSEQNSQSAALKEKTIDSFNSATFSAQTALDKIYNYFIKDADTKNLQFTDLPLRYYVEGNYPLQAKALSDAKALATTAKNSGDYNQVITAANNLRDFLSVLSDYLDKTFLLSESLIINTSYPQTLKDSIKADLAVQQAAVSAVLNSLQSAKTSLINSSSSYQSQLSSLQNSLAISQAELNLKTADPRNFELASASARISQAQASLSGAISLLDNYQIISPIEGKITRIDYYVGEQTQAGKSIIKMIAQEQYEIKVDIPESDITKIKISDKVKIELDAFGSDYLFSGTISFIDPAQTVIQDVTYYRATVSFDKNSWNNQIKPGMTANITVSTAKKENVLYIPQRAVKVREGTLDKPGTKYVEILTGQDQITEATITIGLKGDNGLVEVLSGLQEGEKVITFRK
jgi:RND family efflux transporter MFP subunit